MGFAPSAVVLLAFTMGVYDLPDPSRRVLLVSILLGSIACCFFCARVLFRRKTSVSVAGGVLLLLLNSLISLFLGCATIAERILF